MPPVGVEPTPLAGHDLKSCAYASFATAAKFCLRPGGDSNPCIELLQSSALPLGYPAIVQDAAGEI